MSPSPEEFPPLLADGLHYMTLAELNELCVSGFDASESRAGLAVELRALIQEFMDLGIPFELWVDGSFLTKKLNPADIDGLFLVRNEFIEIADDIQREFMLGIQVRHKKLKSDRHCDVHCMAAGTEAKDDYWKKWYSLARDRRTKKGIAVLRFDAKGEEG